MSITNKKYVACFGEICPKCKKENIESYSFEGNGISVYRECCCLNCGASWNDVFTLTGYENLKKEE